MTRGNVRRLGAAALVFGCLVALPGQAGADAAQTLKIAGPDTIPEGGTATYTISLTEGTDADATVKVGVAPVDPTSGSDISFTPVTVTVPAGGSTNFTVQATQDTTDELNEPFTVSLSDADRATIETGLKTTNIVDDDTPTLSIGNATTDEGAAAVFTISLSQAAASAVTVRYATADGTAVEPGDYAAEAPTTPVTFAPGDTSETIDVQTKDENPAMDENNETFTVVLSNASSNAAIGDGTGVGTITDDDGEPSIASISNTTVTEGNTGTVDATITVTLSAVSGKTVTVPFLTSPGTATAPADYEAQSGNLVFDPGQTSRPIVIKVKGDTLFEPEEKFTVGITDPENAAPGTDNLGEVTITDDDSTPTPTVTNPSVLEGNSGLTDLVFEATLAAPHPAVTFNFRTATGTASGSDFEAVSGSKLFPANSSTAAGAATKVPITVKVKGDLVDEVDETMKLELLNPTTDAIVATGTGTIRNDDNNSKLSIGDASADEPGTMKFTVTLSQASEREVKVNWATADGTATAGVDYTAGSGVLTFAPGEASKTIDVAVTGDSLDEANETLIVNLSNPTGIPAANVLDGQGAGTIVDKNAPPSLSISDTIAREGTGATFTVTLAGTTLQEVRVGFNTIDSTAKAGSDYSARVGTLTFAPGEKSKTITVTILDDTASEPTEEFFVGIGDPVNAAITKNRGVGSIEASDQVPGPQTDPPKPVAKPTTVLVPRMILGPRTVMVGANGIAKMLVTCQKVSPIGCAGTVELERAVKPLLKLGKKTFSVKKGAKGYASIKLTARALKILRKNGTLRAKVIVMVKTSAKTMKVSPGIITLKRTKALMKAKPKPAAPPTKVVVDP
jgi:Calx-beta domain-containing protein